MWHMGLLFIKSSPVKQYSYEKNFSCVFDALHQSFLVLMVAVYLQTPCVSFDFYFALIA